MRHMTRQERHANKGKMIKIDCPTMAEIEREMAQHAANKRLAREMAKPNPIVEYVSLLHLCYHHALKAA